MVTNTPGSFYSDGGAYEEGTVVPNDVLATDVPSKAPSSFYSGGTVVGTGTVVNNDHNADTTPSDTPSSFYRDGGVVGAGTVINNDTPASTTPSQVPSSFYPLGNLYNEADITVTVRYASEAAASAAAALVSQNASKTSETNSKTSETNSKTSETNSAASAAAALASKNAAATSETNAAGSASSASTSASTATTQAGIATTQAGIATTKAANAATSETNSHTSEVNAAASAASAASSASGTVHFDIVQSLTAPQQAQARANVGSQMALGFNPFNKAGDTMSGLYVTAGSGPIVQVGTTGSIQVVSISGQANAAMTFHVQGLFATNFGLASDGNFYMGGWSHTTNAYKFWTTRDFVGVPQVALGYTPVNKAGDVTTGVIQHSAGNLVIYGWGGNVNAGVLRFSQDQTRYLYYDGTNFTFAGGAAYANNGRLWGSSDFGSSPLINIRLVYVGDVAHNNNAGLAEPYAGAVHTGMAKGSLSDTLRYRYLQVQNGAGTWFTAGYA